MRSAAKARAGLGTPFAFALGKETWRKMAIAEEGFLLRLEIVMYVRFE
jgi:hypothetical protein